MRVISVCLALLLALAGCGSAPTAQAPDDAPTTDTTNAPAETTATRTITHALGETAVPANPQRIVSLEHEWTDTLLALGRRPIGSARDLSEIPALANVDTSGIEAIGDWPDVNIEAVLALDPDLIIMGDWRLEHQSKSLYDDLSAIAPVAAFAFSNDWKENFRDLAYATNAEAEAARWMADYEARVAALREQVEGARVSIVRPREGDFLLHGPTSAPGRILTELGLDVQPVPQNVPDWSEDGLWSIGEMSLEWVPNLDGDHIFLISYDIPEGTTVDELLRQPIWQTVPAVKAGNVHPIHGQAWTNHGAHGVLTVIDEVEAALVGDAFTADTRDPAGLPVLEETSEHRLIKHSLGETRVPLQPQRVVTLQDQNALLPLFELGFTDVVGSVGAVRADGSTFYRRMQDYDTSGVTYVGEYGTPNLEQIAALRPDLIVGSQYEVTEENYDLLSQIAPTVAVEQFTRPIWDSHADLALLVNRQEEAAALKARYDARVAELRAAIPDPSTVTVSLINTWEGQISVEASPYVSYITVFNDIGFDLTEPQRQALETGEWTQYSVERLPDFDADVIFVPIFGQRSTENEFLTESPLWQQLNAVQKGQAQEVSGEEWFGMAYQALFNVLDGIERYVIQAEFDSSWEPQ